MYKKNDNQGGIFKNPQIIAALIALFGVIVTPFITHVLLNKDDKNDKLKIEQCESVKLEAETISEEINSKILKSNDDKELINLTYWRDEMKNISNYDCSSIKINNEKINQKINRIKSEIL